MICSKKWIITLIASKALLMIPLFISAQEVVMSMEIEENIEFLLQDAPVVYNLDLKQHSATQQRIDEVFSKYFDFEKAERLIDKDRNISAYKLQASKSHPIMLQDPEQKRKLPMKYSNVWYFMESFSRSYIKEVNDPAKKELSDEQAGNIANKFILDNKLCTIEDADKMSLPIISSRKRTQLTEGGKNGETKIMFKRVEFKRLFQGLEVFNSKQMVDIYPDNLEIVAYKKINWTEVDISAPNKMGSITQDEVVSKINTTISSSQNHYLVTKVERGYYQTDEAMIPIMAVHTQTKVIHENVKQIQEVFLISLAKDIVIEKPQEFKNVRPIKAVKPN